MGGLSRHQIGVKHGVRSCSVSGQRSRDVDLRVRVAYGIVLSSRKHADIREHIFIFIAARPLEISFRMNVVELFPVELRQSLGRIYHSSVREIPRLSRSESQNERASSRVIASECASSHLFGRQRISEVFRFPTVR